ncbi:unnamed protein product [Didymodactylos carnosus]|uniref:Ion transport domain-containing protein n=1 Tax=Didymodactylos carnosus TaxID=1234261 RepID=A0A814G2A7_9BILA|nr:unnamed protein product [Didymodactylos carnosus]CAF0997806.1 unnamed protein product [Didymodactylos carnosus]CAF3762775.1 unnamed protein product [Didymodactylos carnosus]CAF3767505.1 unnamed protein product [Didymodactylos carnosus]
MNEDVDNDLIDVMDMYSVDDDDDDDNGDIQYDVYSPSDTIKPKKVQFQQHLSEEIHSPSVDDQSDNQREWINDLTALGSLMSHHVGDDDFVASESKLVRSKLQRLFGFVLSDMNSEPMSQALGDNISNLNEVDDALLNLNRNATLKFRNYKQFREEFIAATEDGQDLVGQQQRNVKLRKRASHMQRDQFGRSRISLSYFSYWLIRSAFIQWFIGIAIFVDAVSYHINKKTNCDIFISNFEVCVAITSEYSSSYMIDQSRYMSYNIALLISRCVLFIYVFEIILKWIDDFWFYWYDIINLIELLLTVISIVNFITDLYKSSIDDEANKNFYNITTNIQQINTSSQFIQNQQKLTDTLRAIRSYGSLFTILRTLRILRIIRTLEIALRFTQVKIVFLALSRSVKIIFHVVLLTIILIYFFALLGLFITQFGSSNATYSDMKNVWPLFGTVPKAFITVFRLFTKDEWYEIKTQLRYLKVNTVIIDTYVIVWFFFGGYVLNPLLIGAMVNSFDETRKELTQGIKEIISHSSLIKHNNSTGETRKSHLTTSIADEPSLASFRSLLSKMNSTTRVDSNLSSLTDLMDQSSSFEDWLRIISDEMRLLAQERVETQWPIYTAFYYLQLLESLFENLAERQLLFDFITTSLLSLHDKETKTNNPPILSSDESNYDKDESDESEN